MLAYKGLVFFADNKISNLMKKGGIVCDYAYRWFGLRDGH
jgi:hypothetical protein